MSLYIKEKPRYLIESIESMINQTIPPQQIVIVIDGEITTELTQVLKKYTDNYSKLITLVPLKKNLGLGLALNKGLEQCKYELVARMDTDDISYPERCELQLKEFEEDSDLDIIGTLTSEFYETPDNIKTVRFVPENHNDIIKFSKRRSPFNHPTVMFKKSSVLEVGGYRDILRNEDIDLFVRMFKNGSKAKNIQRQLLFFRSNEENFKRRKSWQNNSNYIKTIYKFWKEGHSSFLDFIYVVVTQIGMFISPLWFLKFISENLLRKKHK